MDDESFINLFYLPPWGKMFSVKISFVAHGRRTFFLHFLASPAGEEYSFLILLSSPAGDRRCFFVLLSSEPSEGRFLYGLYLTPLS